MKVENYQILWGENTSDLCDKVNRDISFGWIPLGGVCSDTSVAMDIHKEILLQAMIRYRNE
jgi:hypothetical protein